MDRPLLNNQEIFPSENILKTVMGESYTAFQLLMSTIVDKPFELYTTWNYYKDGKAWLCKVSFKKKTVFWLSVWDKFFKMSFYFTEKTSTGIANLNISEYIKEEFKNHKPAGNLLPLVISVSNKEQLPDVINVISYKLSLK